MHRAGRNGTSILTIAPTPEHVPADLPTSSEGFEIACDRASVATEVLGSVGLHACRAAILADVGEEMV